MSGDSPAAFTWVVYCPTHRDYLWRVSAGGTTWRDTQAEARRYPTKQAAQQAAKMATWRDHRPMAWPLAQP